MQCNRRVHPALGVGLFLFLTVIAGCFTGDPSLTPKATPTPAPSATPAAQVRGVFVGNATCAECHVDEAKSHAQSRHAITLNTLTKESLGALAPPMGPIPGSSFVLQEKAGQLTVHAAAQPKDSAPLTYVLGSGKSGMTYVAFVGENKMAEFRHSYFPSKREWYITPGQERLEKDSLGKVHPPTNARKCMQCHAVTLPEDTPIPEKRFFGVGCESCHGAGGDHVAAMRVGKTDAAPMPSLSKLGATELNQLCGKCHGTKADVEAAHLPKDVTNRMQVFGLMESKCFQKSQDKLSCTSCHNPHENARTDTKHYETACLKCHAVGATPPQRVCPVNTKDKCISCHMPSRKALADSEIPLEMADHRIHR